MPAPWPMAAVPELARQELAVDAPSDDSTSEPTPDLSEWEDSLSVDESGPAAEVAVSVGGEADAADNPEIAETVEEIHFYLEHFMMDQARTGLKKLEAQHQHSHESDWIFLILLLVVALTGVLQHILHRAGADEAANVAYVVHLMGVVPMLGLEVPFSKWSHMAYRPLAMYFSMLRKQMVPAPEKEEAPAIVQTIAA